MCAPNGILILNKPDRISSNQALTRIKHLFAKPHRPRVGHAGTLDPFATGVLLVLLGSATKRFDELMGQPKRYLATVKLGATTPTLDPTVPESPISNPEPQIPTFRSPLSDFRSCVEDILPRFLGTTLQTPPAFSALKRDGKCAYHFAVRGRHLELEPRPITIYSLHLTRCEYPFIDLDITCGRGTYIRALARDIAAALGTVGYLTSLTRTAVGPHTIEQSIPLTHLTGDLVHQRLISAGRAQIPGGIEWNGFSETARVWARAAPAE